MERSLLLPAAVGDVWAVLARFDRISAWAPSIDHSSALSDPVGGLDAARRVQIGRMTLVERIDDWEPPTRLAYTIVGLPSRLGSIRNAWNLEPSGEATLATITTTVDAGPRPPQQLIARVVSRRLAKASGEFLAGLADHLSILGAAP